MAKIPGIRRYLRPRRAKGSVTRHVDEELAFHFAMCVDELVAGGLTPDEAEREAERRFGRKVSWGATCGDLRLTFTTLSTPAMTRLRMSERRVLDTLVDAGVARSRSHALAWCVRLVADKQDEWLADLRKALDEEFDRWFRPWEDA